MKDWIYVGIFFDGATKADLQTVFGIPSGWKPYYDHMTVVFNDGSELSRIVKEINDDNIGEYYKLRIIAVGISEKAMALKVELPAGVVCANKIPHITLGTSPNGKPVDSNNIEIWNDLYDCEYYISGIMRVVKPNKQ